LKEGDKGRQLSATRGDLVISPTVTYTLVSGYSPYSGTQSLESPPGRYGSQSTFKKVLWRRFLFCRLVVHSWLFVIVLGSLEIVVNITIIMRRNCFSASDFAFS